MKKILILSLALAFLFPVSAPAQTVSSVQAEELRQTLITLLTQMIAQLQAQIDEILAKQAVVESKVVKIEEAQDSKVLGSSALSVSYGTATCLVTKEVFGGPEGDKTYDVYNIRIPVLVSSEKGWKQGKTMVSNDGLQYRGGMSYNPDTRGFARIVEITETKAPFLDHKDRSSTSTIFLKTTLDQTVDVKEVSIPACK